MKYCKNCGEQMDAEAKFCASCGENTNDSKIDSDLKATGTTQKNRSVKKILLGVVSLLALIGVGLFIYPRIFSSAEETPLTMEYASGYWVPSNQADDFEKVVYLDNEYLALIPIQSTDNQEIDGYQVTDTHFDEEENSLEISYQNENQDHTLHIEQAKNLENVLFTYDNHPSEEYTAISQETFQEKNDLDVKEALEEIFADNSEDVEVDEEVADSETPELTLENVAGYYVGYNEENEMETIFHLTEDYSGLISIHPLDYSAVAYSGSQINNVSIEEDTMILDVYMIDHHSIRYREYLELQTTLVFDLNQKPVEVYLNGSSTPYIYMELDKIYKEIGDKITFEPDVFLHSLYEQDLRKILDENLVDESSVDEKTPEIWGSYVYEEKNALGDILRHHLEYIPTENIANHEILGGYHLTVEGLRNEGIIGVESIYQTTTSTEGGMGGEDFPGFVTALDYNEANQMITVTTKYEHTGTVSQGKFYLGEDGSLIPVENQERIYRPNS